LCVMCCSSKKNGVYYWCMVVGWSEVPFVHYLVENKIRRDS
jgi:hypothetical protein